MNQDIEASKQESKDTTNTNELSNTSVTLSLKDYEEYKAYKESKTQESASSQLSINERISRELADAQKQEKNRRRNYYLKLLVLMRLIL